MPLYDFKCESCGHEFEAIVTFNVPVIQCPECNKFNAFRSSEIHQTTFILRGGGWYSDLYSSTKSK